MKWKVSSCTRQHSRTRQARDLCSECHTAAFPTLEPRRLIFFEHPFPELNARIGSYVFPTIFLHQKVRIGKFFFFFSFLFSRARSKLWIGWILGAGATHSSRTRRRVGHAHRGATATPQAPAAGGKRRVCGPWMHPVLRQVCEHQPGRRGNPSSQPWPGLPETSRFFCFVLFSGEYSLMDVLLLSLHLIPAATGLPSPE